MRRFLIIGFLIIGIACGGFWYWTTTPQYALEQIKTAIKTHDLQKFEKHVDTQEFSSSIVDDLLTDPMREALGRGMVGRWIVAGVAGFFKPKLVDSVRQDLEHLVETGDYNKSDDDVGSVSLRSADQRLGLRQNKLKKVKEVQVQGKIARVTVIVHNEKSDRDLTLDVQMRDMGGYWQVTRLLTFPEFVSKLIELETSGSSQRGTQKSEAP